MITPVLPEFKRGDTFGMKGVYKVNGTPTPLSLSTVVRAQLRTPADALIAELTVQVLDQDEYPGEFTLGYAPTDAWPVCSARMDIQFTTGGTVQSTRTARLPIIGDVTR